MRTVSQHVTAIIEETPLLSEVISEGIGNSAAIARLIKPDVERRAMEEVSVQAIAMALHRLPRHKKQIPFGFRFLKSIHDITVRSNLTLLFVHNQPFEKRLFERLSTFEKNHHDSVHGVTRGLAETLIVIRRDAIQAIKRILGSSSIRTLQHVSCVTMLLPTASMPVPGVYYPILKTLAWEGINVVELVSAGTELSLFVEDKNVDRALHTIRTLTRGMR